MRISRVSIHNYRSIKDLHLDCGPILVLLGENNAGKSNILSSIEFLLTSSAKPEPEDLFAFRDEGDDALWVGATFGELSVQEQTTFRKYVRADSTIRIRKTARWSAEGGLTVTYNGYVQEPADEWLQAERADDYTNRDDAAKKPFAAYLPPTGRLTKAHIEEAQQRYIRDNHEALTLVERLESGPLLGAKTVASGVLPDFYFVPAVRDLEDEAKVKNSTVFGRLLAKAIEDMAASDARFISLHTSLTAMVQSLNKGASGNERPQQLAALEASLQEELLDWGVAVTIEVAPPEYQQDLRTWNRSASG